LTAGIVSGDGIATRPQASRRASRRSSLQLVRIIYPRAALPPEQKRRIAGARVATVVHFDEVAADDGAIGGRLRSTAVGAGIGR
jgi:phenylpyruvate tautomerase PptA (4-oxalocrotonate tautomerase family)